MTIPTKPELITAILKHLEHGLQEAQESLNTLNQSMAEETKSSAGDKYETQREMLQSELNLAEKQKLQKVEQLNTFSRLISAAENIIDTEKCIPGRFIELDLNGKKILGFLGLGFGDIKTSSILIKGIGLESPLGKQLLNVRKADSIIFNQKSIFISNCF